MTQTSVAALVLLAGIALPMDARAEPSIVGVWRVKNVETKELISGKIAQPFGDHPTGTFAFTQGGHMLGMQYGSNRQAPAGPKATETERAALFSSMSAYSGTYRVEGKQLIITVEDSSIQSWNGSLRLLNIDIEGSRLTGTSEPFKSLVNGLDVVGIVTWERLE